MHFLPDVYVPCDVCNATRYNKETLKVKFKGLNISEVLDLRVDEALEIFENVPKVYKTLKVMQEVGLGYVKLGQSAVTLSGGDISEQLINPVTGDEFPSSYLVKIYKAYVTPGNDNTQYVNSCIISNQGGNAKCISNNKGKACGCCDLPTSEYNPAC